MITFTQKVISSIKKFKFPKNSNLRVFSPIVASRWYAFLKKKTPLSVRRPGGGGAKGGTESVHRNMTFFLH